LLGRTLLVARNCFDINKYRCSYKTIRGEILGKLFIVMNELMILYNKSLNTAVTGWVCVGHTVELTGSGEM
jgi:hypothetical protein